MELTPQINATACAAKGLQLQCTSQFKQVWREKDSHGDYNPTCSDYTDFVTPAPTLAPAPKGSCAPFNQSYAADLADGYKLAQLFPGKLRAWARARALRARTARRHAACNAQQRTMNAPTRARPAQHSETRPGPALAV